MALLYQAGPFLIVTRLTEIIEPTILLVMIKHQYLEQVVDLIDPAITRLNNCNKSQVKEWILKEDASALRNVDGSFALMAREGKSVKLARSMDRPIRYFLAKKEDGPVLIVAERIDQILNWLKQEHLEDQFHPAYTRMVPAHYIAHLELIGCPDPDARHVRYFEPRRNSQPENLDQIGKNYISALFAEVEKWIDHIPEKDPIGVCFSGGIDSGAVFLATYLTMSRKGMNLSRLKAFTLHVESGPDLEQAQKFLSALNLSLFLEPIEVTKSSIDIEQTIKVIEDYKILDVECAAMGLALLSRIRELYPDWKYLIDGDGGDENLKDYPIHENPELTIRSVINNLMLYHEGWGVGKFKHSQTYSGGLSRSYTRSYAPARKFGFEAFSPFTRPDVIEVSEGIPFEKLTQYNVDKLYDLKGEVIKRGFKIIENIDFPVFEKRRFQHGAISENELRNILPKSEMECRRKFLTMYGAF